MTVSASLSQFAQGLTSETAFDVLAVAKQLKSTGKDVVELQIGDSPFSTTAHALNAGKDALEEGQTHYCPSQGLPAFREAVANNYREEFGVDIGPENVAVGPGAKVFEQFFAEAFLNPGDAVLVFTPHFPTYGPNLARRQAEVVLSPLKQENEFRPNLEDVEKFVNEHPKAKGIFLNSPHNPTGGVATKEDLEGIANLIRDKDIALFSDEPYCHMAWQGKHYTPLQCEGMLEKCIACYTFSKSYSMSGWRLGYAISSERVIGTLSKMINTSLSCTPPFVQFAGTAGLENDAKERDETMKKFQIKVEILVEELRKVEGVEVLMPAGTFYVFPKVQAICERLQITSHGLAMFLLEDADDTFGVACLGGECFGEAGSGFLRLSCAEPDDRLRKAVEFLAEAVTRTDRVKEYLKSHPQFATS